MVMWAQALEFLAACYFGQQATRIGAITLKIAHYVEVLLIRETPPTATNLAIKL
jgi:hypothetical protein